MTYWILFIVFIFILLLIVWKIKYPFYHKGITINDINRFIKSLLTQCDDGGLLFIEHECSKRFIQFAKYKGSKEHSILHFAFPDAPWSRKYFDDVKKAFDETGIDYTINHITDGPVSKFIEANIEVDNKNRTDEGFRIALTALKAMGIGDTDKLRIRYEASLDPTAARPSLELLQKHPISWVRRYADKSLKKMKSN